MNSLGLVVITSIALASCSARSESEACAVYRAFFEQLPAREMQVFDARSAPELLDRPYGTYDAPTRFERGAGVMEPPDPTPPQMLDEDTATYFGQIRSKPAIDLAECFPDGGPRLVQPSEIDDVVQRLNARNSDVLSVWTVSPVAISEDGQRALMLGGVVCGSLCGGGAFYLFQKSGEGWTLIGHDNLWVS